MILSYPVFAISDTYFLLNYYFDLANYIYTKVLRLSSNDIDKQLVNEAVNMILKPEQHALVAYILPVYDLTY